MKQGLQLCLIVSFSCSVAFAQFYRPENKATVTFHAMIVRDSASDFLYTYEIKNDKRSKQTCDEFTLLLVDSFITTDRTTISKPTNKKWYIDGSNLGFISGTPASRSLYIPPENGLAPGESIVISFKSAGLPTVVTYYARSFNPPLNATEYDSLLDLGYTRDQLLPDWKKSYYRNQTVAPNTDLLNSPAQVLLDSIVSYKHQSVTLGWLTNDRSRERECEESMRGKGWYLKEEDRKMRMWKVNESWDFDRNWNDGLVGVLDKRLDMAKRALNKGDSVRARRALQIFVMEVALVNSLGEKQEAGGKKSGVRGQKPVMTSEAYALLKYNAEYLIDGLPDRNGRGDEGEMKRKR